MPTGRRVTVPSSRTVPDGRWPRCSFRLPRGAPPVQGPSVLPAGPNRPTESGRPATSRPRAGRPVTAVRPRTGAGGPGSRSRPADARRPPRRSGAAMAGRPHGLAPDVLTDSLRTSSRTRSGRPHGPAPSGLVRAAQSAFTEPAPSGLVRAAQSAFTDPRRAASYGPRRAPSRTRAERPRTGRAEHLHETRAERPRTGRAEHLHETRAERPRTGRAEHLHETRAERTRTGPPGHSCGTTATGALAWCSTACATGPIRAPSGVRRMRRPTTTSDASAAASTR